MDDRHHLTRRQAIGTAGTAFLLAGIASRGGGSETDVAQAASATCTMTPEKTEGPYFVDERLNRSGIATNADGSGAQPGTPLALTLYVFDAEHDCAPVSGAHGTETLRAARKVHHRGIQRHYLAHLTARDLEAIAAVMRKLEGPLHELRPGRIAGRQ